MGDVTAAVDMKDVALRVRISTDVVVVIVVFVVVIRITPPGC